MSDTFDSDEFECHPADELRQEYVRKRKVELDPECWKSYSGKSKKFKRYMEERRVASTEAAKQDFDGRVV